MISITFSKAGRDDIILTETDLFSFDYDDSCFSGDTFELGGSSARKFQITIDNNDRRFSRGTFANCRARLELNGEFYGLYSTELPKRRNGVIELTAYDDMVKLDTEFPTDYTFPQTFWAVYAQCVFEAGLASDISFDNVVLNGVWNNGVITADYTDYIYANSCRNLVAGMAEWNGGYAHINADNKLQVDKFSKTVSREYSSGELMELDYSDETVTFSKVKTSQKNKTYEMGTDDGYTLVLNNQYISYGLSDENFELYLTKIYEYYSGFTLTPMSFTLAEPDFELKIGDRIKVYDEEEQVTVYGNVSKIEISGNLSMTVTCGGFDSAGSSNSFTPTSFSQIQQSKQEAKNGGTAEKLISPDKASHAAVANDSGLWLYKNGAPWAFLIPLNGGFKLGNTGPAQIEMPCDRNTVAVYNMNNGLWLANPGGSQGDILLRGNNSQLFVDGGAMVGIDPDGIQVDGGNSPLNILKTSEGWKIYANNCLLEAKADGLYYNNLKIGGKV